MCLHNLPCAQSTAGATIVAPAPPPVEYLSILGYEFAVTGIDSVATPLGMPKLVLRYIHHKHGNRADCGIGSGARSRFVLPVLIIRFPQQTQGNAGLPALLCMLHQTVHLVLFYTATYGESAVYNQQGCQRRQRRHISKLPASLQKTQRKIPPKLEDRMGLSALSIPLSSISQVAFVTSELPSTCLP